MGVLAILALATLAEPRPVWTDAGASHQGAPSADGKWISAIDPETGDLAVREIATGRMRKLTNRATAKEFAYFSVISQDSKLVAYAWFNEEGYYDLRVVSIDGGPPRVIFRSEEAGFVQPSAFSPDGKWILTLLFRKDNISQIALAPVGGGEVRVLRSLNWVYPKKMDFSPDGRFIVYDNFARDGASQRDIFVLSVDASRETKLIEHSAEDLFPVWTGGRVYFASDRAGTMDLWAIPVKDGRAAGEPSRERRDLGRFLPMGITRDGTLYYGLRTGGADVYVSSWNGKFGSKLDRVAEGWSPALSPDGRRLAWLARSGAENFGQDARVIMIRDGKDRAVEARLAHMERVGWTRDGKALLVSGSDGKGRGGVFRVDAMAGIVRALVAETDAPFRGYEAVDTGVGVVLARGRDLLLAPDKVLHTGSSPLEALATDGRKVAFVDGGKVFVWNAGKVAEIGSGKEWRALAWAGGEWLAAGAGGFVLLPSGTSVGGTKATVTAVSVAGGNIALSARKPRSEIWAIHNLSH